MKHLLIIFIGLVLSTTPLISNAQIDFTGAIMRGVYQGISNSINSSNSSVPERVKKSVIDEDFPEPSRLELRVMQTRKFNKQSDQVVKSIIELYKDKNINCIGNDATYGFEGLRYGDMKLVPIPGLPGAKKGVYKGYFKSYGVTTPGKVICANLEFEVTAEPLVKSDGSEFVYPDYNDLIMSTMNGRSFIDKPKTTILRLRIRNSDGRQSYNPERYEKTFRDIADGLFVDAIQINPIEIQ